MQEENTLNDNQKLAVSIKEGPSLVIAGAGSGKTKVLTMRIAHLINSGIKSSNILAITFTNKAAGEMKERVNKYVSNNYAFIGTFHSFGLKIIKENVSLLGLKSNFTIIDSDDVTSIIKKIMKEKGLDIKVINPSYLKNRISFIKNEMLSNKEIDAYFKTEEDQLVVSIYNRYQELLKINNAVDFDDLLKLPVELFNNNEEILDKYQEKYQYILVDEYQDTNEVQYKLIKLLASKYRNLFVVGDINQNIYGFRFASIKNIKSFKSDYPDAKEVVLNKNYRSTNTILNAANDVIKNNYEKAECNLFSDLGEGVKIKYLRAYDDKQEVRIVTEEIAKLLELGYELKDIAVFYRTNAQSRLIEEAIMKKNYPYKVVGSFYFYKRKEIKDLLSYLSLIANPDNDIALERVINTPKRGIGNKTIDNLKEKAIKENKSIFDVISDGKELLFKQIILDMINYKNDSSLTDLIDYVLDKSGIKEELENDKTLESELRMENLMEFRSVTESYQQEVGTINLDDFLEDISLVSDISDHQDLDNALTLMTIHSAKGLEFKVVFIIGMEDGLLPHLNSLNEKKGLEEERRLCYVAITRAKERLYLTNAKKRMMFGNMISYPPSRFIDEINDALIDRQESDEEKIKKALYSDKPTIYEVGENVYHLSFGKGVVVACDDRFVTVAFSNRYGIKKFISTYQGLKKK